MLNFEVNGDKHMHDQRQGAGERERRGCTMQLYTFVVQKSILLFSDILVYRRQRRIERG